MARRFAALVLVASLTIASFVLLAGGPAPAGSPAASAGTVSASAGTPTMYYNYSDFFNVPYGEWWDMRTNYGYGDEPVGANCFNKTSTEDGTCTTNIAGLNPYSKYPYMDWAGPAATALMWAPYRLSVNGLYVPGYNLSSPVFLPVFNYSATPGSLLSFNWHMQYMDKAEFDTLTSAPLNCYSGSGYYADDGYELVNKIYVTLDNQEAARLFGAQISSSAATMQNWWNNRVFAGCGSSTTGKNAQMGSVEYNVDTWFQDTMANGKYDVNNGYAAAYDSLYTNMSVRVLTPGASGTTQIYLEHGAWGTEILLDRWFYWGNATYAGNQADSSKARGWWGMENGWWEDVHYAGKLEATTMNFNLTGVLQYQFQEMSAPGADNCLRGQTTCTEAVPSDDTPFWTWGPMLVDYVASSSKAPYSELDRFSTLNYLKTTPGSSDYGKNTSFDYVPISWAAKAQENWKFVFPTNTSAYYQNPATAVLGTDPLVNGQLPPISSTLSLREIFPAGYGTWTAGTGTWTVTGGTPESWPASNGGGTYPYVPYPRILLQPPGIPPTVTTKPPSNFIGGQITANGYLDSKGSASTVTIGFRFGTDPTLTSVMSNETIGTHGVGAFSYGFGGLTIGTTYYYRAWASGAGFAFGDIVSFVAGYYAPAVTTNAATGVMTGEATLNGNLDDKGSATTVGVGFYWGTDPNLVGATNVSAGSKTSVGAFSSHLTSLTPGTTYYFRAWANGVLFVNATDIQGFTTPAPPQLSSVDATAIATTTATLNGALTDLGTAVTVTTGFLWSTDSGLASPQNQTVGPYTLVSPFSLDIGSLAPGTTYYFAAWADGDGFSQGATLFFTTSSTPPSVTTGAASGVTTSDATLNGDLTDLGTATSVTVGFLWGTDPTLVVSDNVTVGPYTAAGTFSQAVASLTPGTTYSFQAWADGQGFAAGSIETFTAATAPPALVTDAASAVTRATATLNGHTTDLGTSASVEVGFLWGTDPTLVVSDNVSATTQAAAGTFTSDLTGLTPGATYYFAAWADGDGFVMGDPVSFTTVATPPTVLTNDASGITTTGATLNGGTTALGSAPSVDVGFLRGTDPLLAGATNGTVSSQTAAGSFSQALTGLAPGTTYYFRAWAQGDRFVWGAILHFTTSVTPPSVASGAATAIGSSAATLNGNLADLGTASPVTVGFLWGTNAGLSGATNVTVGPQSATGAFTRALTGLAAGTTHYYAAWASGHGFVQGTTMTFTTLAAISPPSVTTSAASGITASGATLSGNLASLGSASTVTLGFLWGTTSDLSGATNVTVGPETAAGAFNTTLTGLTSGTTYYFEAWTNGDGFAHGSIQSFTTQSVTPPPSGDTFLGMPAFVGYGVLAAILVVVVVAALVVLMMRKRKKSPPETPPPPP